MQSAWKHAKTCEAGLPAMQVSSAHARTPGVRFFKDMLCSLKFRRGFKPKNPGIGPFFTPSGAHQLLSLLA